RRQEQDCARVHEPASQVTQAVGQEIVAGKNRAEPWEAVEAGGGGGDEDQGGGELNRAVEPASGTGEHGRGNFRENGRVPIGVRGDRVQDVEDLDSDKEQDKQPAQHAESPYRVRSPWFLEARY